VCAAPAAAGGGGGDSDEEVYAAAKAMAAGGGADSDDGGRGGGAIEPLPAVDHGALAYEEFAKDFYEEAPALAALAEDEVAALRAALELRVSGFAVPRPVATFGQCGLDAALLGAVKKAGYEAPTAIQRQALPAVLSGRDVLGIAKTGSGKTAAFVLPLVVHCMDQRELERGEGPIALVAAPTRELAEQIHREARCAVAVGRALPPLDASSALRARASGERGASPTALRPPRHAPADASLPPSSPPPPPPRPAPRSKFCKPYGLRAVAAFGGLSKSEQFKALRGGAEVAVATPGRMIDLVKMKVRVGGDGGRARVGW